MILSTSFSSSSHHTDLDEYDRSQQTLFSGFKTKIIAMNSVVKIDGEQLAPFVSDLSLREEKEMKSKFGCEEEGYENHSGVCAICLKEIALQETALVKGCEHAYCVTCILRWATYREHPTCPQCKHPFESLNVHRSLDGRIHDYMFEESVCLLLRAAWFTPLPEENSSTSETYDDLLEYYCSYEEENDEEVYYPSSSSIRICNRRWGDHGYVRAGRQEARPAHRPNIPDPGAGSSREPKMKGVAKSTIGRRAKRTLKREAANKSAGGGGMQEESSEKLVEE